LPTKKSVAGKPTQKTGQKAPKKKRIRRAPEDARAHILDAAEAILAKGGGPAALRLQDVAHQAGVSHPTILHHFGSREGLMRALNLRSLEALKTSVIAQMSQARGEEGIRRTFAAYRDGIAQRLLWLIQSSTPPVTGGLTMFDEIVTALHEVRLRFAEPGAVPDIEDTRAVVHLTTIAAFGDAVIGQRLRQSSGPKERAQRDRFENWFSELVNLYLHAASKPR
jgi:AcrR family transcriptional regulator